MPAGRAGVMSKPAAAAVVFVPTDIAGLLQWYDADDATTFSFSSGAVVSQWRDKSGNSSHIAHATVGNQPSRTGTINSRSAVLFDGINDFLWATVTAPPKPTTIFLVARNTASSAQKTAFIYFGPGSDARYYRATTGVVGMYQGTIVTHATSWGTTAAHLVSGTFNTASSVLAVDSGSFATVNTGNFPFGVNFALGSAISISGNPPTGGEFWTGEICEYIAYNTALSSLNRDSVRTYLQAKWGTP